MDKAQAEAELTQALNLRAQGKAEEALSIFQAVLAQATDLDEAAYEQAQGQVGQILLGLDRPDDMASAYEKCAKIASVQSKWSSVFLRAGDAQKAMEIAECALSCPNPDYRSHQAKGEAARVLKQFDVSAAALQKAHELDPENYYVLNSLLITQFYGGNFEAAKSAAYKGLILKDKEACALFAKNSPGLALTPVKKPFDPNRKANNVICFSLWGDKPLYTHGAIINARLAIHLFPEWTCRFYCDADVPKVVLDELVRLGSQVKVIETKNQYWTGAFWRFFASDDPTVDRFLCRDCDSRLNVKERVAVEAWIASEKPFHIMRDNIMHSELILAGMWGGIAGMLPNVQASFESKYIRMDARHADQTYLKDIVWPLIRDQVMVHDSVYAMKGSQPYPEFGKLAPHQHIGGCLREPKDWIEVQLPKDKPD